MPLPRTASYVVSGSVRDLHALPGHHPRRVADAGRGGAARVIGHERDLVVDVERDHRVGAGVRTGIGVGHRHGAGGAGAVAELGQVLEVALVDLHGHLVPAPRHGV